MAIFFSKKIFNISVVLNLNTPDRTEYSSLWHGSQNSAHDWLESAEYLS